MVEMEGDSFLNYSPIWSKSCRSPSPEEPEGWRWNDWFYPSQLDTEDTSSSDRVETNITTSTQSSVLSRHTFHHQMSNPNEERLDSLDSALGMEPDNMFGVQHTDPQAQTRSSPITLDEDSDIEMDIEDITPSSSGQTRPLSPHKPASLPREEQKPYTPPYSSDLEFQEDPTGWASYQAESPTCDNIIGMPKSAKRHYAVYSVTLSGIEIAEMRLTVFETNYRRVLNYNMVFYDLNTLNSDVIQSLIEQGCSVFEHLEKPLCILRDQSREMYQTLYKLVEKATHCSRNTRILAAVQEHNERVQCCCVLDVTDDLERNPHSLPSSVFSLNTYLWPPETINLLSPYTLSITSPQNRKINGFNVFGLAYTAGNTDPSELVELDNTKKTYPEISKQYFHIIKSIHFFPENKDFITNCYFLTGNQFAKSPEEPKASKAKNVCDLPKHEFSLVIPNMDNPHLKPWLLITPKGSSVLENMVKEWVGKFYPKTAF